MIIEPIAREAIEPAAGVGPDASPSHPADPAARRRRAAFVTVVVALATVPVVRMLALVRDGSSLQYNDYWRMLEQVLRPDGSLNPSGLLVFQNHPVVIPQVLYWVNVKLFGGSNIALGVLVVAIAVALLALVARMAAVSPFTAVQKAALVVMSSFLLFSLNGAWNFVKAMSGAAWMTANVFAIGAVYLRSRDRPVVAFAGCCLAAISYGTGLASWLAVLLVGLCRRPWRDSWREAPFAIGFVVNYLWYRSGSEGGAFASPSEVVAALAKIVALPLGLSSSSWAVVAWVPILAAVTFGAWVLVRERSGAAAAWLGTAAFGFAACLQIAATRSMLIETLGEQNRYSSLASLVWIGAAGLVLVAVAHRRARQEVAGTSPTLVGSAIPVVGVVALVLVAALAFGTGRSHEQAMRALSERQGALEVAIRIGATEGTTLLLGAFDPRPSFVNDRLRATGHHPFDEGWNLDCGLLGSVPEVPGPPAGPIGTAAVRTIVRKSAVVAVSGLVPDDRIDACIVVIDREGVVVGAAVPVPHDPTSADGSTFYTGYAARGQEPYLVAVTSADGHVSTVLGGGPITPER